MGFKGISIITKRGSASKPVIGFRGIVVATQLNLPIKVVDQRGRGQFNVKVDILNPNTSDPFTAFTDSQGNCVLKADNSNPNEITLTLNNEIKVINYIGGSQLTIIFEEQFFPD